MTVFSLYSPIVLGFSMVGAMLLASPAHAHEVTFLCDRGVTMSVVFEGDSAILTQAGVAVPLTQKPAASGYFYTNGTHELRGKEHEATWRDAGGNEWLCRDQAWVMAQPQIEPPVATLAGTSWRLVNFQSSDDAIGTIVPPRLDRYTLVFTPEGDIAMQLDCNRLSARWASPSEGSLNISPGRMTRAACGEGALDTQIARDLTYVRSYVMLENKLALSLEADGGIYLWQPSPE